MLLAISRQGAGILIVLQCMRPALRGLVSRHKRGAFGSETHGSVKVVPPHKTPRLLTHLKFKDVFVGATFSKVSLLA